MTRVVAIALTRDCRRASTDHVTWTPNADGTLSCPAHPDERPFHGHLGGCAQCAAAPPVDPATATGEGERLCIEAAARGLPDGLEVETRAWRAWRDSRNEATHGRKLATLCEERARRFLDGDIIAETRDREGQIVQADSEDQARRWLDLAAKLRQVVAKAIDTQSKLLKIGAEGTALRERQAAKEKRDRLIDRLKGGGSN